MVNVVKSGESSESVVYANPRGSKGRMVSLNLGTFLMIFLFSASFLVSCMIFLVFLIFWFVFSVFYFSGLFFYY